MEANEKNTEPDILDILTATINQIKEKTGYEPIFVRYYKDSVLIETEVSNLYNNKKKDNINN